jgi:hypothetical protein
MDGVQVVLLLEPDGETRVSRTLALQEACPLATVCSVGSVADALQVLTASIIRIDLICMAQDTFLALCAASASSSRGV